MRARFLAERGWGTYDAIYANLTRRDDTLRAFRPHDEVVLWFEHDLYDQLQVAQILDWLTHQDVGATAITMLCIDSHPGVERFRGLGDLTPAQAASLYGTRQPVTHAQFDLATTVWRAFRNPEPTALALLLTADTTALPFMRAALHRHLQQFPSVHNGLGRTENQALATIAAGTRQAGALFHDHQEHEDAPYLGDWSFWACLKRLAGGPAPLLHLSEPHDDARFFTTTLSLTDAGRRVLHGDDDYVHLNGIDQWLGGVHLQGTMARWRWDSEGDRIVPGV